MKWKVKVFFQKPCTIFPFSDILADIDNDDDLRVCYVIADTLERHTLKGMVSHAGKFSCVTCTMGAKTTPAVHWPISTMNGTIRKEDEMKHAAL